MARQCWAVRPARIHEGRGNVGIMATALITGGTSGIGYTFAEEFARRGTNLVLVARDSDRLSTIAADFNQRYAIKVETISADLSQRDDMERVADWIENVDNPIDWLINNAGFGLHSTVLDKSENDTHARALDVMALAVLIIGGAAGRRMRDQGHGRIVNVASSASVIFTGNYSAVKAWCYNYSESLGQELHGTGVTVTALLPGWVKTEFHERAGIKAHSLPDIVWIDAKQLVNECLRDAERGKPISVPALKWKIALIVAKFAPKGFLRFFSRKLSASRKTK